MKRKYELHILIVCEDMLAVKEQIAAALEQIDGVEAIMIPDVRYEQQRM